MKTERFEMRLDKKTAEIVRTRAEKYQMSMTEFAIFCMMNARIEVTIGKDRLYNEIESLRRLQSGGFITSQQYEIAVDKTIQER